jgi:hypothetical protein
MRDDEQHDNEYDDFDSFHFDQGDLDRLDALEAESRKPSKPKAQSRAYDIDNNYNDDDDDDVLLDAGDDWDDPALLHQVMEADNLLSRQKGKESANSVSREIPFQSSKRIEHVGKSSSPRGKAKSKTNAVGSGSGIGHKNALASGSGTGARQVNLFGEVLPMQSSQGMLLVAKKAHTATGTASQKVRDALTNKDHRFHVEGRAKRKEWDRSQPILVRRTNTSSYRDDGDVEADFGDEHWGNDHDYDSNDFVSAPPPLEAEVEG